MRLIVTTLLLVISNLAFADFLDKFAEEEMHVDVSKFPECNDAVFAKDFQAQYPKELEKALYLMTSDEKIQTETHIANIEKLKTKIIDNGVWTNQDAALYFLSLVNSDETKAIEGKKKTLSADFKKKNNAIIMISMSWRGRPDVINRGTCIFGKSAINDALQTIIVNEVVWKHLEQKMIEFGESKNVRMSE